MIRCEYNPMMPCPLNDGDGNCTVEHVDLTLAPYGKLRCDTRMWYERNEEIDRMQSTPLCESGDT